MKLPTSDFEYPSRPKGKRRVWVVCSIVLILWYAMLWAAPGSKSAGVGWHTQTYGMFDYIEFYQYPPGRPQALNATHGSMKVSWIAVALNIVLTVAPTILIIQIGRFAMLPRRSSRFCDECGYDLKLCTAPACPECGHARES